MRQSIVFVVVLTISSLAAYMAPAKAETPKSPTTYPWCLQATKGLSCYFVSFDECMTSRTGLGGHCMRSPYYRGPERQ
jgi:hypothetical protein